ncbi:hypothetical protein [Hymenobacter rigui]|uniref:Uncharacterized protein n=1 Tax=Hymenobacter rigui TaxID=334424 RepID=A0A428KGD7_9BACT|nr:hypothetical protein [Hymenobacter rigui]RSK45493.1 hypothetical protein EI291_18015 [Hymenobacter rigui]
MTDLFVLELVRFSQRVAPFQVQVYKTSWPVEKPFGNDIDLFVQDATGQYDWYALQAKVMSHEGVFNDLKVKKAGTVEEQWHKLLLHEYLFGSQAFYLLYVGESKTNFPTAAPIWTDCRGPASIADFDLTLVKALDIMNTVSSSSPMPFSAVFPDYAEPLRSLFCCPRTPSPTAKKFSRRDILPPIYEQVYARDKSADPYRGYNHPDNFRSDGFAPIRILIDLNANAADENT